MDDLFFGWPLPVVAAGLFLLMALAREGGAWTRRRLGALAGDPEEGSSAEGYVLSAVLGLLALLVAFTFGMALNRHEDRRALVVEEAAALGTAWLRADLLNDASRLRPAMRAYAVERLTYGGARGDDQAASATRGEALRRTVWREAVAALGPERGSPRAALVLTPLNQAFDAADARAAALAAKLPRTVLDAVAVYAIAAAGFLGYATAGAKGRHRLASLAFFALLSLAVALILDLDRPRDGSIRVPQDAMEATVESMLRR